MRKLPKILYVDDDVYSRQDTLESLVDCGLTVTPTDSVDEALELLDSDEFDAVVLDIRMPPGSFGPIETAGGFKSGMALAREIRSRYSQLPLLAVTVSTDPEILEWFSRDQTVGHVSKPVRIEEIARQVRRLLLRSIEPPRAFIVHGRNHSQLRELEHLLEDTFGFREIVILADQPSRGLTVLEKFERYAAATDLVFVLATADDVGRLRGSSRGRSRARQNVIFELGYFLGALRRHSGRVFLLQDSAVEMPSDLAGVVYIDISSGIRSVMDSLRRELRDWIE